MQPKEKPILEENFPLDYRAEVCTDFFKNILAKESFSLVGFPDCNQNILLRYIALRDDVRQKYLGAKSKEFQFIFVDLNELTSVTPLAFYQLLWVYLTHSNDIEDNPVLMLKKIKEIIPKLIKDNGKSLVILFNNYDLIANTILVSNLIAVRLAARYRVSFVFSLNRPLEREEFFFQKIVWIKPFSHHDALEVIKRNHLRYEKTINQKIQEQILEISGGHPGMIKFLVQNLEEFKKHPSKKWLSVALNIPDIAIQSERILSTLTNLEQAKLKLGEKDNLLLNLGLQVKKSNKYEIFSPLIKQYLDKKIITHEALSFDPQTEEVYFWGKRIDNLLTEKEQLLLRVLINKKGQLLKREDLMEEIWGAEEFPTDWAFDKTVSRLRLKLSELSLSQKNYLRTIRNKGILLDRDILA